MAVHRLHQAVGDGVAQGHDLVIVKQAEQIPAALRLEVAEPRHLAPEKRAEGDAAKVALSARGRAGALATDTGSAFSVALAGTVSDIPVPVPGGWGECFLRKSARKR